jgi:outer membrane protein TolC
MCRRVDAAKDRPDLQAATTSLDAAKRSLQSVWFGFLPSASLQSTLTATTDPPSGAPNPAWSVQALLSVPIWDGGARYGNLRMARASEDLAAAQVEAVAREGLIEVERSRRNLLVSGQADQVATRQRDAAANGERLTVTAFESGAATSLELVTASEAHRQAELNLVAKDFDVVRARLTAALALATCP